MSNNSNNSNNFPITFTVLTFMFILFTGFILFSTIVNNSNTRSAYIAANGVFENAVNYDKAGVDIKQAENEWNNSSDDVSVKVDKKTNGDICVIAEHIKSGNTHIQNDDCEYNNQGELIDYDEEGKMFVVRD